MNAPVTKLSPREREVLEGIRRGDTNRQIADALDISQHTVNEFVKRIFKKLGVNNRLKAALWKAS